MFDDPSPDEGTVRLFPLPNLVLFPHVVQPLHVFEPRYRQLVADSLAGDREFALALLRPGDHDQKRPPLFPTVCLGRIHNEEMLLDGRSNLLLHGRRRARLLEELPSERLYRVARVRWLDDVPVETPVTERALTRTLARSIKRWLDRQETAATVEQLLRSDLPLGTICDVLAYALPFALEEKQELLDEPAVEGRVRRLLALLEPQPVRRFPPAFSLN